MYFISISINVYRNNHKLRYGSIKIIFFYRKLRTVLTNRVLRFLHDQSTKHKEDFDRFYKDYGMFLKEGIVTTNEQLEKVCHSFLHLYMIRYFSIDPVTYMYMYDHSSIICIISILLPIAHGFEGCVHVEGSEIPLYLDHNTVNGF